MHQEMAQITIQPKKVKQNKLEAVPKSESMVTAELTTTDALALNPEFNLPQIKYDLKKTGVVVLILAGVIAILYFLDLKHGLLLQFGNWLFKALNIQ